jgi:hypothetical protein
MTYSDDDEGWIESDPFAYTKLHEAGYTVGGYQDDYGHVRYVLFRIKRGDFEKIHDFETLQELQLMARLLIEGGM